MKKLITNTLFGLTLLSSMAFSSVPSWTDNSSFYWLEIDGNEFERGSDILESGVTTGTATVTDEEFDRKTQTWVSQNDDEYYLNTINGTWQARGNSYTFHITGDNNETLEVLDGFAQLDNVSDISGQNVTLGDCFNIPVTTFSSGAKRYSLSWKSKESYQIFWTPSSWHAWGEPYSTLGEFVSDDSPFLYSYQTDEHAGFKLDADLSDGSGDLVIIIYNDGTFSQDTTQIVGTWSIFTLPGQSTDSIKLNITDPRFDDQGGDFATLYDSKVWIGEHEPGGTEYESVGDDEFMGNQIGHDDYMSAMASIDLSKMVNCDIADKRLDLFAGLQHFQISYHGNMNFITEIETTPGYWTPYAAGTWSVENGMLVSDFVNDFGGDENNKTVTVDEIGIEILQNDYQQLIPIMHTTTGRGELISISTEIWPPHHLPETDIPHHLSVSDVKGKKINFDYAEIGGSAGTGDACLFDNMTFSFGNSGDDVGVWKVENGVLMLDTYWLGNDDTTVETGVESWVFDSATEAKVYEKNGIRAEITINSISATDGSCTPAAFVGADAVPYEVSISVLAGKKVVIGDSEDVTQQDTLYFYENMTFKHETHDDNDDPETITGAWSVEEGVVIVDVVYRDSESEHYVIVFDEVPGAGKTFGVMEVVSQGTERDEGIPIVSVSDIPKETGNSGVSPAVIMYLLN